MAEFLDSIHYNAWVLPALLLIPLIGAVIVWAMGAGYGTRTEADAHAAGAKHVALWTFIVEFVVSTGLWWSFNVASSGWQAGFDTPWIPTWGVRFSLGVDGISLMLILLTTLTMPLAVLGGWTAIKSKVHSYLTLLLVLTAGMLGVFVARDLFLFYVAWEVMLVPMYFIIGVWGGERRIYASLKFFIYTMVGSLLMLVAIIYLGVHNADPMTGIPNFSYDALLAAHTLSSTASVWLFLAFFLAFAVKVPMFPFHTWLPDAHVEAPTAISVILAGVLLKMGTYGLMRVNMAILPDATQWAATTMAVFGAINILYGALCAFAQRDLKKLVAYSSVSHMGFCLVGLAAFTHSGFAGAMMQMFNHGTITAMLFLLVGVIYDRAHTREIARFGGLAAQMPRYAAVFGLAFMASLGLPGLSGFIGEVLVFLGAFPVYRTIVIVASLGVVLTAAYHLWALQRVLLGPWNQAWSDRRIFGDLTARETLTLLPLCAIVIVLGFYPMPLLSLVDHGLGDLLRHVTGGHGAGALASLP